MKKFSPSGNIRFYVCRPCLQKKELFFFSDSWEMKWKLPTLYCFDLQCFGVFFIINYRIETKSFLKNIFLTIIYYHKPDTFFKWNTNIRCILKFILLIHKKFKKKYKEFFTIFTANLIKSIPFAFDTYYTNNKKRNTWKRAS